VATRRRTPRRPGVSRNTGLPCSGTMARLRRNTRTREAARQTTVACSSETAARHTRASEPDLVCRLHVGCTLVGRRFRIFNVIDDFNCEVLRIEIDTNLPAARIVRGLDQSCRSRAGRSGFDRIAAQSSSAMHSSDGPSGIALSSSSFTPRVRRLHRERAKQHQAPRCREQLFEAEENGPQSMPPRTIALDPLSYVIVVAKRQTMLVLGLKLPRAGAE
jgi:hypothetical protein